MTSCEHKSLLRFITCGSVGDGKVTLTERLLQESKMMFGERPSALPIDVAYRFFSTDTRNFIVVDTPGHEQHTRSMIAGASTADLAIILIDARKGVLTQTRWHSYLVSLIGVAQVVLAINKLDMIDYSRKAFDRIEADYRAFARQIGIDDITCIPMSALKGDNIVEPSANMPWYQGPTLMGHLETVEIREFDKDKPFRMPVRWVNQANPDSRGVTGTVASGSVKPGDAIRVLPLGRQSRVARVICGDADVVEAVQDESITVTFEDEIDIGCGDIIAAADAPPEVADQFEATLIWLSGEHMLPGRPYLMKIGTKTLTAVCSSLKYKVNVNTLEHAAAKVLELNEIAVCNVSLEHAIPFDPYKENRDTGGFILIDRLTDNTIGVGMLHFALRRSHNIHWQALEVGREARATLKGQKQCILWLTGLSGSGKSTIANLVEKKLHATGRHTYILDGDNVRHGLNKDLGFTEADRVENIRRVSEVAKLMADAGLIVLVSFISPFRAERQMARSLMKEGEFVEVFVDTPLEVAEQRDVKGLYAKARRGQLKNFTGIDSPYEAPENPEIRVDTAQHTAVDIAERIVQFLMKAGVAS